MYCIECGTRNPDEARFCKQCGRRMEAAEPADTPTPKAEVMADETPGSIADPVARYKELLALAFRHYDNGEYEAAKVACSGALALKPDSTDAHALLSTVYERLGDRETAIAEREKVLELNPASIADREKLEALRSGVAQVAPRKILSSRRPDPTFWDTPAGAAVAAVAVTLIVVVVGYAVSMYRDRAARSAPPIQPGVGTSTAATRPPVQEPAPAMGSGPGLTQNAPQQQQPPAQSQPQTPSAAASPSGTGNAPAGLEPLPVRPSQPPLVEDPRSNDRRGDNGFFDPGTDRSSGQPPAGSENSARPPANPGRIEIVVQPPGGSQATPPSGGGDGARMESRNHAEMAMDLQMKGDYKRAAQAWERALEGAGDDRPGLHQKAAMCYQRLNDLQAALRHFTEAIRGFREQIEAGKDVDRAKLGIQACEAGLAASR